MNPFEKFKNGWVLLSSEDAYSFNALKKFSEFVVFELNSMLLLRSPSLKTVQIDRGNTKLFLFGEIIDCDRPYESNESTGIHLCDYLNLDNWSAFYQHLTRMGGSWTILIKKDDLFYVLLDCTGTMPACFNNNTRQKAVSSHPRILANIFSYTESEFSKNWRQDPYVGAGGRYYPGLKTEFDEILNITPNHRFLINNLISERWYPYKDIDKIMHRDMIKDLSQLLTNQFVALQARGLKAFISLSGGLDSRLTLAVSKSFKKDCSYFTYFDNSNTLKTDLAISQYLAKMLQLKHVHFHSSPTPDSEFKKLFFQSEGEIRLSPTTLYGIHCNIPKNAVHMRSNGLEAGRGFYLKNQANHKNDFDALVLSRLFRRHTKEKFEVHFHEFIDKTNFKKKMFLNYHFTDLFYIEHRLGCNYGPIFRGHSGCFDKILPYNSYAILEPLLSFDIATRARGQCVIDLINNLAPELLRIPIQSGSKFLEWSNMPTSDVSINYIKSMV